jgi:hypothetical protein
MRTRGCLALILATACLKRAPQDGAARAAIPIAGIYAMRETMYSSDCSPAVQRQYGIDARPGKVRVDVRNSVPYTILTMTVGAVTYDGQVLPNGRFDLKPTSLARNRVSVKESASGTFTETSFSARYVVEASGPSGTCKVNFRWEAEKL